MALATTAKTFKSLLVEAFRDWQADKAPRLGAALAYYTVFSIAPLLLIAIGMAGFFFGRESVQQEVLGQISSLTGGAGGTAVEAMLKGTSGEKSGLIATIIGFVVLFFGASGVFAQLQDALDTVWGVRPSSKRPFWAMIKDRWISFTMVLGIGFLLLVSLVVSAMLALLTNVLGGLLPIPPSVLHIVNILVSVAGLTVLFAMIFKYLPNVRVEWRHVWTGAAVTALLFTIGKYLIGLYLGHSAVASSYGAAGAVVIIMLWAYYSSQILLYGAEFTQAVARHYNAPIVPAEDFVTMSDEERGRHNSSSSAPDRRDDTARRTNEHAELGVAQMKQQSDEDTLPATDVLAQQEKASRAAMMSVAREIAHDTAEIFHPKTIVRSYPLASLCAAFVAGVAGSTVLVRTMTEPPLQKEARRLRKRQQNRIKRIHSLRKKARPKTKARGTAGSALGALLTAGLKLALGSGPTLAAAMLRGKAEQDLDTAAGPARPLSPGASGDQRFEHRTL